MSVSGDFGRNRLLNCRGGGRGEALRRRAGMALFVGVWDRWDILPREEVDGEVSKFKGMFYTYWVGCLLGKE